MKNVYPLALDYLGLLSRQAYTKKAKNVVQTFPFCWKLSMHTCLAQKTFHTQFVIMLKMVKSNNLLFAYRQPVRMEAGLHPRSWACVFTLMIAIRWSPVMPSIKSWVKPSKKATWSAFSVSQSFFTVQSSLTRWSLSARQDQDIYEGLCSIGTGADKTFLLTKSFLLWGFLILKAYVGIWKMRVFSFVFFCSNNLVLDFEQRRQSCLAADLDTLKHEIGQKDGDSNPLSSTLQMKGL